MLVGRESECGAIDDLLTQVRAGNGGSLVLRGEPGMGKTALLNYAARAEDLLVLTSIGVEPESALGYATLHQLLQPILDQLGDLPPPQTSAIEIILGRRPGELPDRFLVALATLSLLSRAAEESPVLCLVDDAHWTDPASLAVMEFVSRRLAHEPILVIMAVREHADRQVSGLTELPVQGLDRGAIAALLADRGVQIGGDRLDHLVRATGGNPLALLSSPSDALAASDLRWDAPLAIRPDLEEIFLRRVERRDPAVRQLLLLIAADGSGRWDVVRRAATTMGVEPALLETSGVDDLIMIGDGSVTFRHPLIRSAVYQGTPAEARAEVHRALAAALECDPRELPRRAWHLGQAATGEDEAAAELLERSAQWTRGGPAAAAAALERSAELSAPGPTRSARLVAAATAWWDSGDIGGAQRLLDEVDQDGDLARMPAFDAVMLRAMIELRSGSPQDAVSQLMPLAAGAAEVDLPRVIRLLMLYGEAGYQADVSSVWSDLGGVVDAIALPSAQSDADPIDVALARLLRAAVRARAGGTGDSNGAFEDLDWVEQLDDPIVICWVSGLVWGIGQEDVGRMLRRRAVQRAREQGAVGTLAWVLEYLAAAELSEGRLKAAELHAEEGSRFAQETGQQSLACRHRGLLALLLALQGREDARALATESLAESSERGLARVTAQAYQALGLLELVAGRAEEALELFTATDRGAAGHPGISLQVTPDRIEAAARAGRLPEVTEPFTLFARWANGTGAPGPIGLLARCAGLLADGLEAEQHYRRSIALHREADQPLERARTELLLGEHLRRERRQIDARPPLRSAWQIFGRLGAEAWALRAEQELRAAGDVAQRPSIAPTALTHQEQRIVAGVVEGSTNKEIAARLFLSPRTIDYHLRKVFQKLGLRSRSELVRFSLERDS